ncbi:MAG: hypothetical protein ABL901_12475, partial [Hyphomicrobiaceae bacterium]
SKPLRAGIRAWGWWGGHAQSKENTSPQAVKRSVKTSAGWYPRVGLVGRPRAKQREYQPADYQTTSQKFCGLVLGSIFDINAV